VCVDDELQDEIYGEYFRSRMYGKIRDEHAAGEEVRASYRRHLASDLQNFY